MNQVQVFSYKGNDVNFNINQKSMLVNATEMATIFGKQVNDFLRLEQTKAFVKVLEFKTGFPVLKTVKGGKTSGTWMHRTLALKFAAWLNPDFELWVYETIEKILSGEYRLVKTLNDQRAELAKEITQMEAQLRIASPEYVELEKRKTQYRQLSYQVGQALRPNKQIPFSFS